MYIFKLTKSMYTCNEICLYLSNTGADFLRVSDPWQMVEINVLIKNMRGKKIRAGSLSHDFPIEAHIHCRCKQTIPSFLLLTSSFISESLLVVSAMYPRCNDDHCTYRQGSV